jgi:hypothetical protein
MVRVPDHLVSVLELLLGKVYTVALLAGLDHFVAFCLPRSLVQPGQVSRFCDIQQALWALHPGPTHREPAKWRPGLADNSIHNPRFHQKVMYQP